MIITSFSQEVADPDARRGLSRRALLPATHVQALVIPDYGHFVPDEAPGQLLAALIPFLTA